MSGHSVPLKKEKPKNKSPSQRLQEGHDVCVAVFAGHIHGPTVGAVPGLQRGAEEDQNPHGVSEAAPGRVVQRRAPGARVGYVRVAAPGQQQLGHRRATHHHHLCK